MFNRKPPYLVVILLLNIGLLHTAFGQAPPQERKLKLAVLRITYDAFSEEEKETVNRIFYENLAKDERIAVMTEAVAREKLIPLGIEPTEITSLTGYIHAGQLLTVDFVLVGNMDKIGNFVEVSFRVFTMPRGTQKKYPGGKTLDLLIKEEIPNIINMIYQDMGLQAQPVSEKVERLSPGKKAEVVPEIKFRKKPPWIWIALGSVAGGVAAAVLLSSGGGSPGEGTDQVLPRPPIVP
ncbi:MAG: hypothetical protein ACE5IR_17305 [bacterium]